MGSMAISVRDCRAVVSRRVDLPRGRWTYEAADNWEDLESDAIDAVEAQGGAVNMSSIYRCPLALFERAEFSEA